jgi:thiol-disulfide isomerase/thioredoxin
MRALYALFAAAVLTSPAMAATAPRVAAITFSQLKQPLPYPYDENADAKAAVARARAQATREHKLLLIDFGGNWCADCRILAGTMDLPELKPFVARHYVEVTVDVGRFNKNLDIWRSYGQPERPVGVPAVFIVDPRSNRLINRGHETALADARTMTPQSLADWLAQWVK